MKGESSMNATPQVHIKQPEDNLVEYLKTLPRNQVIKLGSKDSSCFFWFGTAGELLNDIDLVSDDAKESVEKKAKASEKSVTEQIRAIPTISDYLLNEWRQSEKGMERTPKFSMDDYIQYVTKKIDKIPATAKNYKKVQTYLDNWKDLEDRKVCDHYPSITEDAEIVIIEGMEPGPWWDAEEKKRNPDGKEMTE